MSSVARGRTGHGITASAPSLIHLWLGFLASFLREAQVIHVSYRAAAVIGCWIIGVEVSAPAESLRQVRIGQEFASKGNQVGSALLEPGLRNFVAKTPGENEGAAIFLADHIQHTDRALFRCRSSLDSSNSRIHHV